MPLDIFKTIFENQKSVNAENGFNNEVLFEPSNTFKYKRTGAEKVIEGPNNSFIVLGRDRPGPPESGYGGKGHMKCGAIDIVAGRLSSVDATSINGFVSPSYGADAARVYLSQKADIDTYFSIVDGRTGPSIARSAVGIKADDVRIIARNSMKLVTNTDSRLSTGDTAYLAAGVQLIANNNDSDMQPIPKGNNVVEVMVQILERLLELNGAVQGFMEAQKILNEAVMNHTHLSPFFASPTAPSIETKVAGISTSLQIPLKVEQSLTSNANNLAALQSKYFFASSDKYINSKYHFLN